MKKTIAIMIILAAGCMSLAGCASAGVTDGTAENTVTTGSTETTETSVTAETSASGETQETSVISDAENPAGGYIRYTYKSNAGSGERNLSKVEEYDADGNLISDMNYGSVGTYGVTNVYVDGLLAEEWYTNTDGETYLSSRLEHATFGANERTSISYHYDHGELTDYTEYEYDAQGEHYTRTSDYDAGGNLTGYTEYEYAADGSNTSTGYNADGTPTGSIVKRNSNGDMVTKISGYGSNEHVYRTEYIRNYNGDVIRIERYEDDVLQGYNEYEYDSAGRRSSITAYQADGTALYTTVCEYEYPNA